MEPKVINCSEKYVLPLNKHFSGMHHSFLLNFCEAARIWGHRLKIQIYIYVCFESSKYSVLCLVTRHCVPVQHDVYSYFGACSALRLIEAKMTLRTKDATQNEPLPLLLAWHGHNSLSEHPRPLYRSQ